MSKNNLRRISIAPNYSNKISSIYKKKRLIAIFFHLDKIILQAAFKYKNNLVES